MAVWSFQISQGSVATHVKTDVEIIATIPAIFSLKIRQCKNSGSRLSFDEVLARRQRGCFYESSGGVDGVLVALTGWSRPACSRNMMTYHFRWPPAKPSVKSTAAGQRSTQPQCSTVYASIMTHVCVLHINVQFSSTRTVQPVATCRQSPYLHKPAIVKLLLLIYSFQFSLHSVQQPRPASRR